MPSYGVPFCYIRRKPQIKYVPVEIEHISIPHPRLRQKKKTKILHSLIFKITRPHVRDGESVELQHPDDGVIEVVPAEKNKNTELHRKYL